MIPLGDLPQPSDREKRGLRLWEDFVNDPGKARPFIEAHPLLITLIASQVTGVNFDYTEDWEQYQLMYPIIRDTLITALAVGGELGKDTTR